MSARKLKAGDEFIDQAGNRCIVRDNGTLNVITVNDDPSMTIQSEKDSCDINKIVARFKATGVMSNIAQSMPQQGDFTEVTDYHSAMNQVVAANEAFMALPAHVRKRFANDPGNLLAFLEDPQNQAEAVLLGLANAPQPQQMVQGDEADQSSEQSST